MYATAWSVLSQNLGIEVWPRQNDLYTMEKHLLYQYVITSIYREQKLLGMLNPLAPPFYLPMENETDNTTVNEKTNQDMYSKDTTKEGLQDSNKYNIKKEEDNKINAGNDDWTVYSNKAKPI